MFTASPVGGWVGCFQGRSRGRVGGSTVAPTSPLPAACLLEQKLIENVGQLPRRQLSSNGGG